MPEYSGGRSSEDVRRVKLIKGDQGLPGPPGERGLPGNPDNVLGVIVHGSDSSVERPTEFDHYMWVGDANPDNASLGADYWLRL